MVRRTYNSQSISTIFSIYKTGCGPYSIHYESSHGPGQNLAACHIWPVDGTLDMPELEATRNFLKCFVRVPTEFDIKLFLLIAGLLNFFEFLG